MDKMIVMFASAAGALFVVVAGGALPDPVASHFGATGQADGFMSRPVFLWLMGGLAAALPLFVWWGEVRAFESGKPNIPHAAHWLGASERERSLRFVGAHAAAMAVALAVFLAFVFGLVVDANTAAGAKGLDVGLIMTAIVALVVFLIASMAVLWLRFARRSGR